MQKKLQKLLEQAYELCEDGNYVRALEYYDIALDIEPDNLNVMVDKGVTLQNLGRFNEALQMYEKALSIETENLDALIAILPAMKAPTISTLINGSGSAVEIIVEEKLVRDIIPLLLDNGATDIIEYPLNKVCL